MKPSSLIFAASFVFMAGCFAGSSQIGSGAGLNPTASPLDASGMAGPSGPGSVSGDSGAAGGDAGAGEAGPQGDGASDPTAGSDSPITVVGTPMGASRKPGQCPRGEFRLCFHDLTISSKASDVVGRLNYDVTGVLATQPPEGGEMTGVGRVFVEMIDLLFPDKEGTSATDRPSGEFVASVEAAARHGIRFQAGFCRHITTLDVILPKVGDPPLVLDPCGGTDPTDVIISSGRSGPLIQEEIQEKDQLYQLQ